MTTVTFDTLKYVKQLEASGVAQQQAEAFVTAQRDILSETLGSTLVTKLDMASLKNDISREIGEVKSDLNVIRWMMGVLIAVAIANFAKQFF